MRNMSVYANEFLEKGRLDSISIIDMHTHMGDYASSYLPNARLVDMIGTMDKTNTAIIVSAPHTALFDPLAGNTEIEAAMCDYPERIRGYYSFNPNFCDNINEELDRFSKIKGYAGFKLLPDYHRYPLDGQNYEKVLEYADEKGLLVLSHTWGVAMDGHSYSSIAHIKKVTSKYRNMKFIMGHSAQGQCEEAIELASGLPNVYLELTDTYRLNGMIEKMVKGASSEKILFGTDLPWYDPHYCLGCILFAKISDIDKANIIYKNASGLLNSLKF